MNAYAEAMVQKLEDMYEHARELYGMEFGPRVVGPFCTWPRRADGLVVIGDPNVKAGTRFLLDERFGGP